MGTEVRVVEVSPAPTFEVGQLVLVSIPGLGYLNTLAEVVEINRPIVGCCEIFILADRRHRKEGLGNHSRTMPNRALRLASREEIAAGIKTLRQQFHLRPTGAKHLVVKGDGWGWKISAKEEISAR